MRVQGYDWICSADTLVHYANRYYDKLNIKVKLFHIDRVGAWFEDDKGKTYLFRYYYIYQIYTK